METQCETISPAKQNQVEFCLEWEGKNKHIGDAYAIKNMLEQLAKLGYKEFKIFVE